jgi:hypothetical protein
MSDDLTTADARTVDPYNTAREAIAAAPPRTGLSKAKRADLDAHAVIDALRREGLLSEEAHLRVMISGHLGSPGRRSRCPACDEDVAHIGLTNVAFTYECCDCNAAPYVHLVEQLWHRRHVGEPRATS